MLLVDVISVESDTRYDNLTPLLGLQYILLDEDAYTERGTGALLSVSGRTTHSVRGSVGVRASRTYRNKRGWNVTPQVQTRYVQEFISNNGTINTQIAGGGGGFTIAGNDLGEQFGEAGVGVTTQVNERVAVSLGYDLNFGHRHAAHTGYLGLTLNR